MRLLLAAIIAASAAYIYGFARGYWFRDIDRPMPPIDDIDWTRGDPRLLTFPYRGVVQ